MCELVGLGAGHCIFEEMDNVVGLMELGKGSTDEDDEGDHGSDVGEEEESEEDDHGSDRGEDEESEEDDHGSDGGEDEESAEDSESSSER